METIVMKFGGTSVATPEKIIGVAERAIREKEKGKRVVIVVSAMGKTTDTLLGLAGEISAEPPKREMDMLLATGEQITISLLAMAFKKLGHEALSFTGWQAGIETESVPRNARIEQIHTERLERVLDNGYLCVVAGFQGVDKIGNITTLGRGGSDTTAVALAAALGAEKCEIYTDVDGVYTSDPRFVTGARKLEQISYDEMLELANLGAGVLHPRAVEFAKNNRVPLSVRASYSDEPGTIIQEVITVEKNLIVRGVAFEPGVARVTVIYKKPFNGSLANIFTKLAENQIDVDIIVQSISDEFPPSVSFSISQESLEETRRVLTEAQSEIGFLSMNVEIGLSKVSIVGSGMVSNPGVAARMFDILRSQDIPVKMVSTSEIKISVVVPETDMKKSANALHEAYGLSELQVHQDIS
ncbi:aspartate kinase [Microbacterium sp. APC 3898]|uniref:Aspartokinase n=1 Tax=Planococcus notacanthi TaxID=3035188 RepID=A0ABT7ZJ84_9BACL|nr:MULTISPECIES: aspartate kinase [Terrabacteria group]MDN3426973.1 aspartate kinase [Planococcus sp. APC 4016]MDN3499879.1 aspartate kinase [Microbacterium sp. APC 3898]